jgi:hypothetical protein
MLEVQSHPSRLDRILDFIMPNPIPTVTAVIAEFMKDIDDAAEIFAIFTPPIILALTSLGYIQSRVGNRRFRPYCIPYPIPNPILDLLAVKTEDGVAM